MAVRVCGNGKAWADGGVDCAVCPGADSCVILRISGVCACAPDNVDRVGLPCAVEKVANRPINIPP